MINIISDAAKKFATKWSCRGHEKSESQIFWLELLTLLGVENATDYISFESVLHIDKTAFIDGYIKSTKVLIEQKSRGKSLSSAIRQSDGKSLTPFQQARRYIVDLPVDDHPRWVVTSNFEEIWVYDMNHPGGDPEKIRIDKLDRDFYRLEFLVKKENPHLKREKELSIQAGEIVGDIYKSLLAQYVDPESEQTLKSLNVLCVRLVFLLYAEDAEGVFDKKGIFGDYLRRYDAPHVRKALIELFRILDTPVDERDSYLEKELQVFPYVNGGLFADTDIEIPNFSDEGYHLLLDKASDGFNWAGISPTIFGAVFESTLNVETRRANGMHYTSLENIHKVIDPLYLNNLRDELDRAKMKPIAGGARTKALTEFRKKLGRMKWLDPACGSGNFLTETYICVRRLENEAIEVLAGDGQISFMGTVNPIEVSINQFYGIELNDFAVSVAKTALWIAENQMLNETKHITYIGEVEFLPLTTNAHIKEANALRMDWESLVHRDELSFIMGNPPFVGYSFQSPRQKEDILLTYVDENGKPYKSAGKLDYVAAWYFKASQMMEGTSIQAAFVSTNSITQGEQVSGVWKPIYDRFHIHINFAYRTFVWNSEANQKAHVHVVIIGFSCNENKTQKVIYDEDDIQSAEVINPYLLAEETIFIEKRSTPLCDAPQMTTGNRPADGGNLIIEASDYEAFIKKEPNSAKYIKKLVGSDEFINKKDRYCLWLVGASPSELRSMPEVMKRIEACRNDRLAGAPDRQKLADMPALFRETKNPSSYVLIPSVSSAQRRYIPMGFLDGNTISTNLNLIIPNATIYHFGVLTSAIHMAWVRTIAGRLKSDYRYSKDIVYNNFPWPSPTDSQREKIISTAQSILDARALYPDASLADLYDELTMPPELRKAHRRNDIAVMEAYGFTKDAGTNPPDSVYVAKLMKIYENLTK